MKKLGLINFLSVHLDRPRSLSEIPETPVSLTSAPNSFLKHSQKVQALESQAAACETTGHLVQAAESMHRALLLAQHTYLELEKEVTTNQHQFRNKTYVNVLFNWVGLKLKSGDLATAEQLLTVLSLAAGNKAKLMLRSPASTQGLFTLLCALLRLIWLEILKENWVKAEDHIRKAKLMQMEKPGLWLAKVKSMECSFLLVQHDKNALRRLMELHGSLREMSGHGKEESSLVVLSAVCCCSLAYAHLMNETRSEMSFWLMEAKRFTVGLKDAGLTEFITFLSSHLNAKPPKHSKSEQHNKRVSSAIPRSLEKPTLQIPHLQSEQCLPHSATAQNLRKVSKFPRDISSSKSNNHLLQIVFGPKPDSVVPRPPQTKRRKHDADSYSSIEKILKNPQPLKSHRKVIRVLEESRQTQSSVAGTPLSQEVSLEPVLVQPSKDSWAVRIIQIWWKKQLIQRRHLNIQVTKLQALWKGYLTRKTLKQEAAQRSLQRKNKEEAAARLIQRSFKQWKSTEIFKKVQRKFKKFAVAVALKRTLESLVQLASAKLAQMKATELALIQFRAIVIKAVSKHVIESFLEVYQEKTMLKNALILETWFRQKLALYTIWEEYTAQKKAEASTIDYQASVSTKPETSIYSLSESRLDFQDMTTDRSNFSRATDNRVSEPPVNRAKSALVIQRAYRRHRGLASFRSLRKVIVYLQAWMRGRLLVQKYKKMRSSVTLIQKVWKGIICRKGLSTRHKAAQVIQTLYRGHADRKRVQKWHQSARLIQVYMREKLAEAAR